MPLIDRTKKQGFDVNVNPNIVALSKAVRDNNDVIYNTIDANYNEFAAYKTGIGRTVDGGFFTDTSFPSVIDGGTFT